MKEKKWLLFTLILLVIDQVVKVIVRTHIAYLQEIQLIPSFFSLTYVENKGGAWSVFKEIPWLLTIFASIFLLAVLLFFWRKKISGFYNIALPLLLGGATGNLIDRIFFGAVTDYLSFTIFGYAFPIFNFADICVVIGVFLFIINEIRREKEWNIK